MQRPIVIAVSVVMIFLGLFQFRNGLIQMFEAFTADSRPAVDRQVSAASQQAVKAAADFNALAKDAHQKGNAPRGTDPAVTALLDKVFATEVLASRQLIRSDLDAIAEWP